jgi:hypothetical protein
MFTVTPSPADQLLDGLVNAPVAVTIDGVIACIQAIDALRYKNLFFRSLALLTAPSTENGSSCSMFKSDS